MADPETKLDRYFTTVELAEILKIRPNTLVKWRVNKQEVIPYIKIQGRILYPETAVLEWLTQKRTVCK